MCVCVRVCNSCEGCECRACFFILFLLLLLLLLLPSPPQSHSLTRTHTQNRIPPNQMVNLGYLISGPNADAVKMGAFKVTSAKWCDQA